MRGAIIFDINETVLDLAALDPLFAAWFGDPLARHAWFHRTIHLALTLAATRTFATFSNVGRAALDDVAGLRKIALPGSAPAELSAALRRLPPHPDVIPALQRLQDAGFRLAALSNNPLPVLEEQLGNAGITPYFAEIISVDEAGALKPAPEVYHYALQRLDLAATQVWMVAAHGWDIAGATRAGLRGAFVARAGQHPDPLAPPEVFGVHLLDVADQILATLPPLSQRTGSEVGGED